jgi:uncharacterized membrane protein
MHSVVQPSWQAYACIPTIVKGLFMLLLVLGLLVFLGTHSLRIAGDTLRVGLITKLGPTRFKMVYTVASLFGFSMVVYGFGLARDTPVVLWTPLPAMKYVSYLLTLVAMVFMAAVYVPRNAFKAKLHHPMVLSVKTWALAHLLANGTVAHLLLFGSLLLWSVLLFKASRARDKREQVVYGPTNMASTVLTLEIGFAMWLVWVGWVHGWLIGVQVFP